MSAPLTYPMRLALQQAAAMDPHEWWLIRPRFHKSSIYALERRGLAEVDQYMGHFRLTDTGREAARTTGGVMTGGSDWRGPMRRFRVSHYDNGKFTHGEEVQAHQVSLPARGMHYYDIGGEWVLEVASNTIDGAEVVRLYAEIDGDWRVVFEAPEGSVSVREMERAS